MMSTRTLGLTSLLTAALVISASLAGCTAAGGLTSGSPAPSGSPKDCLPSSACSTPAPSAAAQGFYLRTWQTQALAPQYTFGWMPLAAISDGQFVNGLIAIPTIFPGPLYIGPQSRTISDRGIATIIAEAQRDGLLDGRTDYANRIAPGAMVAHLLMVINGVTYDLSGPTSASDGEVGGAFSAFLAKIQTIDTWLAPELGAQEPYAPKAIAVMTQAPAEAPAGFTTQKVAWPLAGTFATFGTAVGGERCSTVTGSDLAKLLPVLQNGNQLTRFDDTAGVEKSLQIRVLFPGEGAPCK